MKIYLAGKIPKGKETSKFIDWRDEFRKILNRIDGAEFLTPVNPDLDESVPGLAFGFACSLVQDSDVVLVDGSNRIGIGTAQEILIAKYFRKFVVCYLPKGSPHRRTDLKMYSVTVRDWIHPFVAATSDRVCERKEQVFLELRDYSIHRPESKGLELIDDSIAQYLKAQDVHPIRKPRSIQGGRP